MMFFQLFNKREKKDDELLRKLQKNTFEHIKKCQGMPSELYVPIEGCEKENEGAKSNLETRVIENFLSSNDFKILLLTGNSGSGKTSFGQELVKKLWNSYQKDCASYQENNFIPLWIPLLSIVLPDKNLLLQHLENNLKLLEQERVQLLESKRPLLLILDGYDELNIDNNLFIDNEFDKLPGKIIFTCRNETLKANYRQQFMSMEREQKLLEYCLRPFDEKRINTYLNKYVDYHCPAWDFETYQKKLHQLPELEHLINNPFILSIVLKTLPNIVDRVQGEENIAKRIIITRQEVYQEFMNNWFERRATKIQKKVLRL